MAAPKLGARTLAAVALAAIGLASGCYTATPHRATVASTVARPACAKAVTEVFARSGFIQLPSPSNLSMLFGARVQGPYTSFLRTGAGVGVKVTGNDVGGGSCEVTLEALSADAGCADSQPPLACGQGAMNVLTGDMIVAPTGNASASGACPVVRPLTCELSYAPGAENDAAVDELARRVRAALGPMSAVN